MGTKHPKVDAYIAKAPEFARPILERIRKAAHAADKELGETIKWGHPFFEREGLVAAMSAHKAHVRFGFWLAPQLAEAKGVDVSEFASRRFETLRDLPTQKALTAQFKEAIALNLAGVKRPSPRPGSRPAPKTPPDLAAALKKNAKARRTYEAFSPSCKREYVEWITEAKREATREKRLAQAIEWMAEGKKRNWKYQ